MKPLTKSREQIYFITVLTRLGSRDTQGCRPHQAQLILVPCCLPLYNKRLCTCLECLTSPCDLCFSKDEQQYAQEVGVFPHWQFQCSQLQGHFEQDYSSSFTKSPGFNPFIPYIVYKKVLTRLFPSMYVQTLRKCNAKAFGEVFPSDQLTWENELWYHFVTSGQKDLHVCLCSEIS